LTEAREAHTGRVAKLTKAASTSVSTTTFSKTAMAAILTGAGAVGRACKLAFSYGLETDPGIAAKFLAKLTLGARHSHVDICRYLDSSGFQYFRQSGKDKTLMVQS
jgi:hypothetical protein